jgi:hypothetical protein
MDNAIAEEFCNVFEITREQIKKYEDYYANNILPVISRHYLSHLVTTIEELINEKEKRAFLEHIRSTIDHNAKYSYSTIERAVNHKMLRLFSIILVPIESGKLKARAHFIGRGHGVLITYWKQLPEDQIRILIAHELGHVATKYLFDDQDSVSNNGLATLFAYIALQDRNNFYKNVAERFTRKFDMQIYNDIANICNRSNM